MAPGGAVRTCSLESGGAPSKSKGRGERVKCRLRVAAARPRLPPAGEVLPPLGCLSEGARGAEDGRANQTCTRKAQDTETPRRATPSDPDPRECGAQPLAFA